MSEKRDVLRIALSQSFFPTNFRFVELRPTV